jgi:IS5 family transposase
MHCRYSHAKQYKRATKLEKSLKTLLGRMIRMIQKLAPHQDGKIKDDKLRKLLELAERLMAQEKTSKNKIYSVHEPEVKCIPKDKAHKRYEFGCKVSVVTTNKSNWVVGIQALDGNPFDGHTLQTSVTQMERITGQSPEDVVIDQGYKWHDYSGPAQVHIVKKLSKSNTKPIRNMLKRRAAIEPVIGHLKSDHRMDRNYLRGVEGDRNNAILAGIGFNLRKLLRWVIFALNVWLTECLAVIKSLFWGSNESHLLRI